MHGAVSTVLHLQDMSMGLAYRPTFRVCVCGFISR